MNSTLIIGIGTTGLSIIEEIQQLHYELCNSNKPGNNVAYIYLETDASRKPRKTPNGTTSIEQVVLRLGSNAVDIRQLKANNRIDSSWIPEPNTVLQNEDGAGGMPSYGRLSFWGNQNYQNLANIIRNQYNSIGGDSQTQILIVGSVTGGTGSGLVIDIPYLVKNITNNPNVEAILLLPDRISLTTDKKPLHENAFSALAAIDFFSRPENTYKAVYPTGTTHEDQSPPYKYVQYLSQDFDNSKASIKTLGELVRIAGAIGLMRILDTNSGVFSFYNRLNQRRVDSVGYSRLLNTLTSGFQVVQYPKAQLEQLLSINLSKDILEGLVDQGNYVLPNNVKKPIKADELNLKLNTQQKFDDILERVFKNLDNLNTISGNLTYSLKNDVKNLVQKTHGQQSNEKYIYNLFSINTKQNYFELLKNNEVTIKNIFIDELYELFKGLLREYKNFHVLNLLLDDLEKHIDITLAWYKKEYGLTGAPTDWNTVLTKNIENSRNNKFDFQSLFLISDFYNYSINHLLNLLKINSIIPVLEKIKSEFKGTSTPLINPQSNRQLPTKLFLQNTISRIEHLINNDGSENDYTLRRRSSEINLLLDNDSACFRMVYTTGSKSEEIAQITSNYARNISNKLTLDKLLNTGDFWEFFLDGNNNLYETVISNAQRFIQSSSLIGNFDFGTIRNLDSSNESVRLIELFNGNSTQLKEKLPAMVPLDNSKYRFADDPSMKTIVLTNDHKLFSNLFPNYNLGDTNSNIVDLPSLTNTIVLYQEYCYLGDNGNDQLFNPIKHISYMNDVKKHVAKLLIDEEGNLRNEDYMRKKVPYLSFEQFKKYLS
jgi:hypothetical protein